MAERTTKQGVGVIGFGVAACAVCCAPPIIGFLAAASVGTLVGVALFGMVGLALAAVAVVAYLRRHRPLPDAPPTPVALGRKTDA